MTHLDNIRQSDDQKDKKEQHLTLKQVTLRIFQGGVYKYATVTFICPLVLIHARTRGLAQRVSFHFAPQGIEHSRTTI
jgi:hypothetical protein